MRAGIFSFANLLVTSGLLVAVTGGASGRLCQVQNSVNAMVAISQLLDHLHPICWARSVLPVSLLSQEIHSTLSVPIMEVIQNSLHFTGRFFAIAALLVIYRALV